jgi:hypothetical protein
MVLFYYFMPHLLHLIHFSTCFIINVDVVQEFMVPGVNRHLPDPNPFISG